MTKIKNWFSPFKSTHYLTRTAILTALLMVVGLLTVFFKFSGSAFQFADGFYLSLICLIPGPMMLVSGIIYPVFFDLLNGGFVFIPASIVIHCLMFILVKILKKPLTGYGAISVGGLMIFIYVLYNYLINLNLGVPTAKSMAINELIVDAIQYGVSVIAGWILYFGLSKPKIKRILV